MSKYVKKPVVIDAVKWTGESNQADSPEWMVAAIKNGDIFFQRSGGNYWMNIRTLEGTMMALPGDYIIKGIKGELYPCKPDIFDLTYEAVTKVQPALLSDEELEILGALNIQEGKCDCHEKSQIEARKAIRRGAILGEPLYCEKCIPY